MTCLRHASTACVTLAQQPVVRLLAWQTDKSEVTRDIASPFAYGKVRTDYPVLKGFSDAELYEGMGDYVPPPPPNPSRPAAAAVVVVVVAVVVAAVVVEQWPCCDLLPGSVRVR